MANPAEITQENIGPCALCKKGILRDHNITFYRITVEQFVADPGAIQRALGFEAMMMGNAAITRALSPNEVLAKRLADPEPKLVCMSCALEALLGSLLESR